VKDIDEILPDDPAERIEAIQGLAAFFREVSDNTGIDLDPSFLYDDPPNSTWPACLAFKAAMRQGRRKGETFLRRLRRACLQKRKNITKSDVLESIARDCGLDVEEFLKDFYSEETEREVHEDIEMGVKEGITGMPALVFGNQSGLRVTVLGPRSLQEYRKVIRWLSTNQSEDIHRSFYA
jgi:predicted DsbA family dithiol-disulfide isomerase